MSSDEPCILDTVVLLYFLLVERFDLLRELVGTSLRVPLAVYDPEDRELSEEAPGRSELLSEIRQCVRHYQVLVRTDKSGQALLDRVRRADLLFDDGDLETVAMTDAELTTAAVLQSRDPLGQYGIRVPLGAGEAACVAIAHHRSWTIATDDDDALTVMHNLHEGRTYRYERIRKLLIRAGTTKRITRTEANQIHTEMRALGFWDSGKPFR